MSKIYSLFIILLLCSCGNHFAKSENALQNTPVVAEVKIQPDSFETGKIISPVGLRNDASQSFALYLPKNYSDSVKLPVMIFFDPHGDGNVPLNLYHELAEEFHFILISSNSSKNGMDLQQTKIVADNLVNEATSRFHADDKRISLCGFSGGAKVALLSAANNSSISSVIYCGAVAPVTPSHQMTMLGFAGTRDMNYTDVVSFDWGLKKTPLIHYLVEWNGKHEFPTAEVFKDAFNLLSTGGIPAYEKKLATITPQKLSEEQANKQQLMQAFQTQDLNWWKNEINLLNAKKKTDAMYERLLGFISLACYSYSNQTLQQNNLEVAEKILAIYQLADPGNKDCETFTAELQRRKQGR